MSELGHPPRTVILGIGNVLMQDEGAGVHAVRALAEQALGPGFEVVDGGTLGIELLPIIEDAGSLILIDAARFGGAPEMSVPSAGRNSAAPTGDMSRPTRQAPPT